MPVLALCMVGMLALIGPRLYIRSPCAETTSVSHTTLDVADGRSLLPLIQRWGDCADGIYLDVGSNVAVQIRKLYDPLKFPGAKVLPVFDRYFGTNRTKVCAVGFEPNIAHKAYLETLNAHFEKRGLPAYVFTEVAVSSHRGNTTFFTDSVSPKDKHEWAASLVPLRHTNGSITVQLVDLQNFIMNFVVPTVQAQKQKTGKAPPIVMKLDVEGAEFMVLPAMIVNGALCHIDLLFAEWHDYAKGRIPGSTNLTRLEMLQAFQAMRVTHQECKVQFSDLDDESYVDGTSIPL